MEWHCTHLPSSNGGLLAGCTSLSSGVSSFLTLSWLVSFASVYLRCAWSHVVDHTMPRACANDSVTDGTPSSVQAWSRCTTGWLMGCLTLSYCPVAVIQASFVSHVIGRQHLLLAWADMFALPSIDSGQVHWRNSFLRSRRHMCGAWPPCHPCQTNSPMEWARH